MERKILKFGELMPVPKLDFSGALEPFSDEEYEALERKIAENSTKEKRLQVIEYIKAHPERLHSWDMPFTLAEYERRLKAGEFD